MITVPKMNESRNNFPCWKSAIDDDGNIITPVFYCKCGLPIGIDGHSVDASGVVSPSVWHQKKNLWELRQGD